MSTSKNTLAGGTTATVADDVPLKTLRATGNRSGPAQGPPDDPSGPDAAACGANGGSGDRGNAGSVLLETAGGASFTVYAEPEPGVQYTVFTPAERPAVSALAEQYAAPFPVQCAKEAAGRVLIVVEGLEPSDANLKLLDVWRRLPVKNSVIRRFFAPDALAESFKPNAFGALASGSQTRRGHVTGWLGWRCRYCLTLSLSLSFLFVTQLNNLSALQEQ